MDQDEFRRIAGMFATSVVAVTSADPATGALHGVTVNAFASVSLEPPLLLVCINQSAQSHDFLMTREHFAVNVLARRQVAIAERFAGRAPLVGPAFEGVAFTSGIGKSPLLRGSVAWFECRRVAVYPAGDHSILLGEVLQAATGDDDDPLVFFGGAYTALVWG